MNPSLSEVACHFHLSPKPTEAWVQAVAKHSGCEVDWGCSCGYAVVCCSEKDVKAVQKSIGILGPPEDAVRFMMRPYVEPSMWVRLLESLKAFWRRITC